MKNLLVPIDLSDFSTLVVDAAIKLAKENQAKITLLNVVSLDIGFVIGDIGFQYLPQLEETALKDDAQQLNGFEQKVKDAGVECHGIVKQGIPTDVILEMSEETNADLIVIGSQGHGTLYEALVGSVCHDVIKESNIPIYVIPKPKK